MRKQRIEIKTVKNLFDSIGLYHWSEGLAKEFQEKLFKTQVEETVYDMMMDQKIPVLRVQERNDSDSTTYLALDVNTLLYLIAIRVFMENKLHVCGKTYQEWDFSYRQAFMSTEIPVQIYDENESMILCFIIDFDDDTVAFAKYQYETMEEATRDEIDAIEDTAVKVYEQEFGKKIRRIQQISPFLYDLNNQEEDDGEIQISFNKDSVTIFKGGEEIWKKEEKES